MALHTCRWCGRSRYRRSKSSLFVCPECKNGQLEYTKKKKEAREYRKISTILAKELLEVETSANRQRLTQFYERRLDILDKYPQMAGILLT